MTHQPPASPPDLRTRLDNGEFITAPGVFDMISALLADRLGFPALYLTGYGMVASHLGLPDAGLAGYRDFVERVARIGASFDVPLLANMVEGGKTPLLPRARLRELGYRLSIHPACGFLAAAAALAESYGALAREGSTLESAVGFYPFEDFSRLMGFEAVWEFEKRYGD